jgi:hypothetical protein
MSLHEEHNMLLLFNILFKKTKLPLNDLVNNRWQIEIETYIMYNIDGTCFENFEQNSVKGEFQRINVRLAKRQSFRGVQ